MNMSAPLGQRRRFSAALGAAIVAALLLPAASGAATCAVPGDHATIAAAIADNSCDPINVAAGTYPEALDITRSVAIHGAGAGTTTIAPTSKPTRVVGIRGSGVNVELDGFTIRYASGAYPDGSTSAPSIGVQVYEGAAANVHGNTITQIHNDVVNGNQTGHCVIVGEKAPSASTGTIVLAGNTITYCAKQGVTVRVNSTATITNNVIAHGNQGEGKNNLGQDQASNAIVLWNGSSSSVSGNDIHDWKCPVGTNGPPPAGCAHQLDGTASVGILIYGAQAALNVSGNHIHDTDGGIYDYLGGPGSATFANNQLDGNIIYNAYLDGAAETWTGNTLSGAMYGAVLYGEPTAAGLTLAGGNTITGATSGGVVTDTTSGAVSIAGHKNSFVANAGGIDTTGATSADLTCNWWGAQSGPTAGSNPGGSGDATSANTVFSPFSANDTVFDCGTINPQLTWGDPTVAEGGATTLTLTLTNGGADPAGPASVDISLPPGFAAGSVAGSSCSGAVDLSAANTPAVSGVLLAAAGTCTIVLNVTAGGPGNFTTTIPAGGVQAPNGNSTVAATAAIVVSASVVPPGPPIDPLPACYRGRVLITDVRRAGSRAIIQGVSRVAYAGQTVVVRSMLSGRVIARPSIAADGTWRTNVAAPPRRLWGSNRARYRAEFRGTTTIWTKLTRRMGTTTITDTNGVLSVRGSASTPLARGAQASVQASYDCARYRSIGRIPVTSSGAFNGSVAAPATNVFFVRVRVSVRNSRGLVYSTYSIIQPVIPR
jgi:hypothetical protein